jgi:hypothetical protein
MTKNGIGFYIINNSSFNNFRFEFEEKFMGTYQEGNSTCFEERLEKYKIGSAYFYAHHKHFEKR